MTSAVYSQHLFSTDKADIYIVSIDIAQPLQAYLLSNKQRLAPFEPHRLPEYYDLDSIETRLASAVEDQNHRRGISFVFTPKDSEQLIGSINYSGFMFGVFQAGYLGFSIDKNFEGKGIMTDVLQGTIDYVRHQYSLHRIMANHLPDNERSAQLLNKLGFVREGYAKSYLKIDGRWQDHVLNALVFHDD